MITESFLKRFYKLREDLFAEIAKRLAEDGYGKSYEGALSLRFPSYFEQRDDNGGYEIRLDC